jgi:acyl-CoA reductase LuxC
VTVEQLVPSVGTVEVGELLCGLRTAPRRHLDPFGSSRIDFSDAVSRAIFRHPRSRAFPEMLALAFWLRRAAVSRLAERFAALQKAGSLRAPRGLAFHLPPANVDTLFVYSLLASFLVGNLNVVRISRSRYTDQVTLLCEVLRAVLAEDRFAEFSDELAVVSYAHEAEPTAAVSKEADVRLLWGGDETIEHLRTVPISAAAHDVTFGDRFSFAVLRPDAVLDADHKSRSRLAEQLFNDAYWFDQLACSSPRLLVWVGGHAAVDAARQILFTELARVVAVKGYRLGAGAAIAKLTFIYEALIDRPIESVYQVGNELAVLSLEHLTGFDRTHPGGGLFFEARVNALSDLVTFVNRKDQTVTAHGFSAEELTTFARSLHGRGIDRIVGFGDALTFTSLWDGYDLLAELTRTVHVPGSASQS